MEHSSRLPPQRPQLEAKRREHTLVRPLTSDLAQMQASLPLQAVNLPQAQAHSDTLLSKHSSLRTACPNSQHMDSLATQTQPRNSRHMASLRTASQLATRLLRPDTLSSPLRLANRGSKESLSNFHRWVWVADSPHSNRSRLRSPLRG